MYNDAIRWRIVTFHGDRFPTEGELCVSFLYRVSCWSSNCPFGPCFWRRQWWNFKSKFHCFAFLAMTFPDGVVRFLYGPANDRTPQRQSHFTWVPIKWSYGWNFNRKRCTILDLFWSRLHFEWMYALLTTEFMSPLSRLCGFCHGLLPIEVELFFG